MEGSQPSGMARVWRLAVPGGGQMVGSNDGPASTNATWWRRNLRTTSLEEQLAWMASKTRRTRRWREAAAPEKKDIRLATRRWRAYRDAVNGKA
ncbi:hypothetical protein Scep_027974 [Stephania cephalantha]|uniref:Uncharacterized protein n=1 Tax=Stephania cephalantha TaxID=152367 RepID=A0AAP0EDM5_9MAGN